MNHSDPKTPAPQEFAPIATDSSSSSNSSGGSSQSIGAPVRTRSKRSRFGIRFGLLELLMLTALIACWLPVVRARRQIPDLQSQVETMRLASLELIVDDPANLNARSLPGIWHNINSWKYFAPEGAQLELRLATEGINSVSVPANYKAVDLPKGEHAIHLKVTEDDEGYHSIVYIDQELVLQQHHGPGWIDSYGSSSTSDLSGKSSSFDKAESLVLKKQKYSVKHPLRKNESMNVPDEYDHLGNFLWISPKSLVPEKPTKFFVPQNRYSNDGMGHRQGIKVNRVNQSGKIGLIGVSPSFESTMGDNPWTGSRFPLAISVRPVLEDGSEPEPPETQPSPITPSQLGLRVTFRNTMAPPENYDGTSEVTLESVRADEAEMRFFAHYPTYPSGAKPIVEVIFDEKFPNRVGFLPHAAPDSVPIQACQLVTLFDARFFWRKVEVVKNGSDNESTVETVPLENFYSEVDFASLLPSDSESDSDTVAMPTGETSMVTELDWKAIDPRRLPQAGQEMGIPSKTSRLSFLTDVADSSKIVFPLGLPQTWRYQGVPNRQVWFYSSDNGATAEVRASGVFPTTDFRLPGGPAVGGVRITIPMPATEPAWLEIAPEMK